MKGIAGLFPGRYSKSGFTLIELMVVVAIIALFSGIVLPFFLSNRRAAEEAATSGRNTAGVPQKQAPGGKLPLLEGIRPIIDSAGLSLGLSSSYHRIGMEVYTRFILTCKGKMVFSNPGGDSSGTILLFIPFPMETMESRDVVIKLFEEETGSKIEPSDLFFHRTGIYVTCNLPPGKRALAELAFTAIGRDQLALPLPPSKQLRSVAVSLDIAGADSMIIPDDSLQPTETAPKQLRWNFENLVSDRQIIVEIPGAQSPMARVLLLLRLMAVSVFLFGGGFWYLSEQYNPGQLDDFRFGHFLLLALTYSLFFVIFSVLEFHGTFETPISMALSALFSLPLIALVISPILGRKFAISRLIPFSLFTLALVINGVYGKEYSSFVFIVAVILVMAYVTLSYEGWAAGREEYHLKKEEAYSTRRHGLIQKFSRDIGTLMNGLLEMEARGRAILETEKRSKLLPLLPRVKNVCDMVPPLKREFDFLSSRIMGIPAQLSWEEYDNTILFDGETEALRKKLTPCLEFFQEELKSFRKVVQPQPIPGKPGEIHCMACGKPGAASSFCQHCGEAHGAKVTCSGCNASIALPIHAIPSRRRETPLFCQSCGTQFQKY